jgi:cbb3-type cytochrome oxidase subunit 1
VCRSRLAPWYILAFIITLAVLYILGLFLFRKTSGRFPF